MSDEVKLEFIDVGVRVSDASGFVLAGYSREEAWSLREKLNAAVADGRLTEPLSREFHVAGEVLARIEPHGLVGFPSKPDLVCLGPATQKALIAWINAWAERGVFEDGAS